MERSLLREGAERVVCVDEVGRGALAGPVSVGVVVVDAGSRSAPQGLRDSKLLTPIARSLLAPKLRRWAVAFGVGHASAAEIDEVGILAALRVAASRALGTIDPTGPAAPVALLDGNHNWLKDPDEQDALFPDPRLSRARQLADLSVVPARVVTRIKADLSCAGVAAASVLAKCERDALMEQLGALHPEYGWESNKGYGAPEHVSALRRFGPSPLHRNSWRLPLSGRAEGAAESGSGGAIVGWESAESDPDGETADAPDLREKAEAGAEWGTAVEPGPDRFPASPGGGSPDRQALSTAWS